MGFQSSMSILLMAVIFLAAIESNESKESVDSRQRFTRSADCVRGVDGSCQPLIGEEEEEEDGEVVKRQSNCDRKIYPNCRLSIGRKRSQVPNLDPEGSSLDCSSPVMRTSVLCKVMTYLRRCQSGDCDDSLKRASPTCDTRSPLCYITFPGKRLGKQDELLPSFHKRQATEFPTEEGTEKSKKGQEGCNPKRDYFCRHRVPGKRNKIIETSTKTNA